MTHHSLPAGTLWQAIRQRTREALASGALHSIQTSTETIEDSGIPFIVCIAASLTHKNTATPPNDPKQVNPFLPPEPALVVGEISSTHLAVLNKFNIVEHHLLLVTRTFEHQETLLTRADFEALQTCLAAYDGLGFHNAGRIAGASQAHKHLQVVPLPLWGRDTPVPIEPLFADERERNAVVRLRWLPFAHAFTCLPSVATGELLYERYQRLLTDVGLTEVTVEGERRQSAPYNLLVTRRWMLLVPRTRECFDSISINAVAFAGSLFVRNAEQLRTLRACGPIAALRYVTSP